MHHAQNLARRILVGTLLLMLALVARAAQAQNITLQWDPNAEADVAGYWVYIGNAPGNYTSTVDVGNVTSYTFDSGGQHYCFAIAAYVPGPVVGDKSLDVCTEGNQPPTLIAPGNRKARNIARFRPVGPVCVRHAGACLHTTGARRAEAGRRRCANCEHAWPASV